MIPGILTTESIGTTGAHHAFTTRIGGVSRGVFSSLNFGNPSELPLGIARDTKENIEENFRRTLEAIGCAGRRIIQVHQVHGPVVHVVARRGIYESAAAAAPIDWGSVKADAIVTDDPASAAVVRVADCCPILLSSGDGRVVGAVHAGWRGIVSGVVPAAVEAMRRIGAEEITAAIGPCISAEHFEVGPEVVAEFLNAFGDVQGFTLKHPDPIAASVGKAMIDIKAALRRQLVGSGVCSIETLPHCTFREEGLFFSHRRDSGVTGRMIGIIAARTDRNVD